MWRCWEYHLHTMYTQRTAEKRIRTRDSEKWIPHKGSRKIRNQNKGCVTQERSLQEESVWKRRLLRMQIRWQRKNHMQQGEHKIHHNVHRKLWKEGCIPCGETSYSAYTRGKEHLDNYYKRNADSPLHNHCENEHQENRVQFKMDITDTFHRDSTSIKKVVTIFFFTDE